MRSGIAEDFVQMIFLWGKTGLALAKLSTSWRATEGEGWPVVVENGPKEANTEQLLVTATWWDHLRAGNRAKGVGDLRWGVQDVVKRGATPRCREAD